MFIKKINNIKIYQYPRSSVCVLTHFDCKVDGVCLEEFQTLKEAAKWASETFDFISPRTKKIRQLQSYSFVSNSWF
jgi:hypothetical protein